MKYACGLTKENEKKNQEMNKTLSKAKSEVLQELNRLAGIIDTQTNDLMALEEENDVLRGVIDGRYEIENQQIVLKQGSHHKPLPVSNRKIENHRARIEELENSFGDIDISSQRKSVPKSDHAHFRSPSGIFRKVTLD